MDQFHPTKSTKFNTPQNLIRVRFDRRNLEASKTTVAAAPVEQDSQEDSTGDADLNIEVIRLKNSNILNDLNQKLGHLTSTKREVCS